MRRYYSIGILLILLSTTIVTADPILRPVTELEKMESLFVMCSFENQFTVQELEEMRDSVIANFKQNYGKPGQPIIFSSIEFPDGAIIAAYGFKLFKGGVTAEYLGIAHNPQSVSLVHENAQEWNMETETSKGEVNILGTWDRISSGSRYEVKCPYGAINNNYEVFKCTSDNSATYDWYLVKQEYKIRPGIYECGGSDWKNEEGTATHDWSVCTLSPYLVDWEPRGTQTGPTTVSVQLSAGASGCPEYSWTFDLGAGAVINGSATSSPCKAVWVMTFTTDAARSNPRRMEPGSLVRINEPGSPGTYKLVKIIGKGKFKSGTSTETVSYTWTVSVTYT